MKPDTLIRLEQLLLILADQTERGTYERSIVAAAMALLGEIKPPSATTNPGLYRVH